MFLGLLAGSVSNGGGVRVYLVSSACFTGWVTTVLDLISSGLTGWLETGMDLISSVGFTGWFFETLFSSAGLIGRLVTGVGYSFYYC